MVKRIAAPLCAAFLFASCAGAYRLTDAAPRKPVQARYLYELFPEWQPVYPGIDCLAATIRHPRLRLWAIRADLRETGLSVVLTPPERAASGDGGPPSNQPAAPAGHILSTKVSSFARANDCLVAINAGPFWPVNAREGEDRAVIGLFIADGQLIAPVHEGFGALVFDASGGAAILRQAAIQETAGLRNAVGGFYLVLEGGQIDQSVFARKSRHPRSAAGLSPEGRYLYLLAIDGRQPASRGATEAETGLILRSLGAESGLNFDGGGSTALALRVKDRFIILNTPIHNHIPGRERAVATCFGLRRALPPQTD